MNIVILWELSGIKSTEEQYIIAIYQIDTNYISVQAWNLGVDFGVLDNRISGSIDLYKRTTKDMLWNYQVATPPYLYQEILANAGTMQNKGLEIHLSAIPVQTKEFSWTTSFNYSTNKNKLVALSNEEFQLKSGYIEDGWTGEPIQQYTHRIFEGGEVGNFYGFKLLI